MSGEFAKYAKLRIGRAAKLLGLGSGLGLGIAAATNPQEAARLVRAGVHKASLTHTPGEWDEYASKRRASSAVQKMRAIDLAPNVKATLPGGLTIKKVTGGGPMQSPFTLKARKRLLAGRE